jgi:Ni/Co efflux regulator RcnB
MDSRLSVAIALVLAVAAAAPARAQHKTYYYRPVTRDAYQHSSSSTHNVYRNPEEDEFPDDPETTQNPQRKRYTYTAVHRDRHLYSPYRYQPSVRYPQPQGHHSGIWWNVGNRLPSAYYAPIYVVDFRRYRLPAPPTGFRWVRVENDVYLVHSSSGLIRDAVYQLFY